MLNEKMARTVIKLETHSMIAFDYINWKGIEGHRTAKVQNIYYGTTEYHPEVQWLLEAYDYDKKEKRIFAMKDMSNLEVIK